MAGYLPSEVTSQAFSDGWYDGIRRLPTPTLAASNRPSKEMINVRGVHKWRQPR